MGTGEAGDARALAAFRLVRPGTWLSAGQLPEFVWRELKEALPKHGLLPFLERHPERFNVAPGKDGKLKFQVFAEGRASSAAAPPPPPAGPPLVPAAGGVASWKVADVVLFLHQLELAHLGPIVKNEGVDGAMLLHLVKAGQLCDLGFSKFQAQKIIDRLPTAHGVQDPGSSTR